MGGFFGERGVQVILHCFENGAFVSVAFSEGSAARP